MMENIRQKIDQVETRISNSLAKCGRKREEIKLIVVSKGQMVEKIQEAYLCGIRRFGENYPEETSEKLSRFSPNDIEWHMIGHLQSRKAKIVAASFHMLQSLDSIHTAQKLDSLLAEVGRKLPVLIEINVSGEETKSGINFQPGMDPTALYEFITSLAAFPRLEVRGLMTMPPLWSEPEKSRPYFRSLRLLMENLEVRYPQNTWKELSMGTSGDFETAIEEGSTMIRIGQAILGERTYQK